MNFDFSPCTFFSDFNIFFSCAAQSTASPVEEAPKADTYSVLMDILGDIDMTPSTPLPPPTSTPLNSDILDLMGSIDPQPVTTPSSNGLESLNNAVNIANNAPQTPNSLLQDLMGSPPPPSSNIIDTTNLNISSSKLSKSEYP